MRLAVISAVLLTVASPAMAGTVLNDTFDGENGGSSALGYNSFANFVVSRATVDLIRNGDFGLTCVGGTGSCVDLGGTGTSNGRMTSRVTYNFLAGDTVTLRFLLSGNQRPGADADGDIFGMGFQFAGNTLFTQTGYDVGFGSTTNAGGTLSAFSVTSGIAATAPFATRSLFFTAGGAGSFTFYIEGNDNDDFGPVLDNVTLDITSGATAVPEPATWGMMLLGFGMIGAAARKRSVKTTVRFA